MGNPRLGVSKQGKDMHYSVGALIERNGEYLLIDRAKPPLGFAGIAGHIDEEETPEKALLREVGEESGLKVESYKLIFEEEIGWNQCRRGIGTHYWYVFDCKASGQLRMNVEEANSIGWFSKEEMRNLKLEPIWGYWFKKLNLI